MTQPTEPSPRLTNKLLWFVAFWLVGVGSIAIVGYILKAFIKLY